MNKYHIALDFLKRDYTVASEFTYFKTPEIKEEILNGLQAAITFLEQLETVE